MPILLPLLASAGSAYLQHRGQKKQLERDEARNKQLLNKNRAEAAKRQAQVEGSFGVNKYALEALEQARGKQGIKEAQDQANLSAANQIELAARLGARGGVNAAAIERSRQNQVLKAGAAQRQQERAALNKVGAERARLDDVKRDRDERLEGEAARTAARAQENLFNVQDAKANLNRNLATNLISSAMPLLGSIGGGGGGAGAGGGSSSTAGTGLDIGGGSPLSGTGSGFNIDYSNASGQGGTLFSMADVAGGTNYGGFGLENIGQGTAGLQDILQMSSSGGLLSGLNMMPGSGKHGMKTPGKFSHETNPINLMQNGSKVGEVTGGEYVVNPGQAKKIAEQSAYARMLFKKFDKEA